jgi:hypothetical protein
MKPTTISSAPTMAALSLRLLNYVKRLMRFKALYLMMLRRLLYRVPVCSDVRCHHRV